MPQGSQPQLLRRPAADDKLAGAADTESIDTDSPRTWAAGKPAACRPSAGVSVLRSQCTAAAAALAHVRHLLIPRVWRRVLCRVLSRGIGVCRAGILLLLWVVDWDAFSRLRACTLSKSPSSKALQKPRPYRRLERWRARPGGVHKMLNYMTSVPTHERVFADT